MARERLAVNSRPVRASLSYTSSGIDLTLSTASLNFVISADASKISSQHSSFIRDQIILPLFGYAASAESLIDPPEELPEVCWRSCLVLIVC